VNERLPSEQKVKGTQLRQESGVAGGKQRSASGGVSKVWGEEVSTVTVYGRIAERPSMSETARGELLAHFHVVLGSNEIWCVCVGPLAENVRRFGAVGAEVLGWGQLDWPHGQPDRPYVRLDRLAFANPREVATLMQWDMQP
jgi:hypothetical protein